jgi:glycerol-3-phosphate acyltransferase PlsX
MGGDHGLPVVVPACVRAVKKNPDLQLLLVGVQEQVYAALARAGVREHKQIQVIHASEQVAMDELPSHALRGKRDSSMRVAINLVKEGRAQACVSAGNTGALMATARFVLKTLPGIDRPAIISTMPSRKGTTRVMDLGANVDSCAENLFQFAVMGSALIQAVDKIKNPKIALLNIGVEEIKGNDQVKHTAHMLSECKLLNYVGYAEGSDFYTGEFDLIVCDGFVGNAALKASEGLAHLVQDVVKQAYSRSWYSRLAAIISMPVLNRIKQDLDPAHYNGATMLGLNGIVVKSHGGAHEIGFLHAIEEALVQVKTNVVDLVKNQINAFVNQGLIL